MSADIFFLLLSNLCQKQGISPPLPNKDNIVSLSYQDCILHFEYFIDPALLFLYAHVGNSPSKDALAFFKKLLQANCLYQGTGGCTLGLDGTDRVILSVCARLIDADFVFFQNIINNFAFEAKKWTNTIESFNQTSLQPEGPQGLRV